MTASAPSHEPQGNDEALPLAEIAEAGQSGSTLDGLKVVLEMAQKSGALKPSTLQNAIAAYAKHRRKNLDPKLVELWESPSAAEARRDYLKDHAAWKQAGKALLNPSGAIMDGGMRKLKRWALPDFMRKLSHYDPQEIYLLVTIGALNTEPELAEKAQSQVETTLTGISTALNLGQLVLPELAPVAKGAALVDKASKPLLASLPGVRAEMAKEHAVNDERQVVHDEALGTSVWQLPDTDANN